MEDLAQAGAANATVEAGGVATGAAVVRLIGEIDLSNAESVRDAIEGALEDGVQRVTLDLRELQFIDSSGLAMLLGLARTVLQIELRDPLPVVRRCLELTGLTSVFAISPQRP